MARTEARLKTSTWNLESDFRLLDSAPQRLYLLILSQPDVSLCGVAPLAVGRWADMAADTTEASVRKAFKVLTERRYLVSDWHTLEVAIRTFVKNDGVVNASPKIRVGVHNAFGAIQSPVLRASVQQHMESVDKDLCRELVEKFGDYLSIEVPIPVSKGVGNTAKAYSPRVRTRPQNQNQNRNQPLNQNRTPSDDDSRVTATGIPDPAASSSKIQNEEGHLSASLSAFGGQR